MQGNQGKGDEMKYMKRKKTRGRTDLYGKRARNREDGCGETSVSVYSHTREPPDGGRGGGIRNISIVICHSSPFLHTWTLSLAGR